MVVLVEPTKRIQASIRSTKLFSIQNGCKFNVICLPDTQLNSKALVNDGKRDIPL